MSHPTRAGRALRLALLFVLPASVSAEAAEDQGPHFTVAADRPAGSVLGTVCSNEDCAGAVYRIVSGNDEHAFHVDPFSGEVILLRSVADAKLAGKRVLVVEERREVQLKSKPLSRDFAAHAEKLGADAANLHRTVTRLLNVEIEITPPAGPFELADWIPAGTLVLRVPENCRPGSPVDKLAFSTGSFERHLQFELVSQPVSAMFEVSTDGRVTVSDPTELDYESRREFPLQIRVSDGRGESVTIGASVQVGDVNEAPVVRFEPLPAEWPPAEKSPIARVRYEDPDANDEVSIEVECSNPAVRYDAATGDLFWTSTATAPRPDEPIEVRLRATDAGGLSVRQSGWISFPILPADDPKQSGAAETNPSEAASLPTAGDPVAAPSRSSEAVPVPQPGPESAPQEDAAARSAPPLPLPEQATQTPPAPPPAAPESTLARALNGDRIALIVSLVALAAAMLRIRALRLQLAQERRWAELAAQSAAEKSGHPRVRSDDEPGEEATNDDDDLGSELETSQPVPCGYQSDAQLKLELAELFAASDFGQALDLSQLTGTCEETPERSAQAGPIPLKAAASVGLLVDEAAPVPADATDDQFEPTDAAKGKTRELDDVQLTAFRTIANTSARSALKTHGQRQRHSLRVALSGVVIGLALFFPANNLLPTDPTLRLIAVISVILAVMFGLQQLLKSSLERLRHRDSSSS